MTLRQQLWQGVPLKQALQDAIARNNTGYSYKELKQAIKSGEDMLEDDELQQVNATVNLLAHMFTFYSQGIAREARLDELKKVADYDGMQGWGSGDECCSIKHRIAELTQKPEDQDDL